jgi:hypothetical protein
MITAALVTGDAQPWICSLTVSLHIGCARAIRIAHKRIALAPTLVRRQ